jgi:hypothetical protein
VSEPVRVLLLEMPQLLRELLGHAVETRSDCMLLSDARPTLDILLQPTPPPDVVIVGLLTASDAPIVPALFARWPEAKIMTVSPSGEGGVVYEMRPHQRILGEMSPAEVIETLWDEVRQSRGPVKEVGGDG